MTLRYACPDCEKPLEEIEYRNGAVFACASHGVKRWFFDEERSDLLFYGPGPDEPRGREGAGGPAREPAAARRDADAVTRSRAPL